MNELEIYDLFTKRLHRDLKEKIDASVFVTISNDILVVRISKLGLQLEQRYPNILNHIINERDTSILTHEIVKHFRRMVVNTFFY